MYRPIRYIFMPKQNGPPGTHKYVPQLIKISSMTAVRITAMIKANRF